MDRLRLTTRLPTGYAHRLLGFTHIPTGPQLGPNLKYGLQNRLTNGGEAERVGLKEFFQSRGYAQAAENQ